MKWLTIFVVVGGFASYQALQRRGARQFLKARAMRLGRPVLAYVAFWIIVEGLIRTTWTSYIWHSTAYAVVWAAGWGLGWQPPLADALWWLSRSAWALLVAAAVIGVVRLTARFELGPSRKRDPLW